jgi:hypothetical protein
MLSLTALLHRQWSARNATLHSKNNSSHAALASAAAALGIEPLSFCCFIAGCFSASSLALLGLALLFDDVHGCVDHFLLDVGLWVLAN